MAAVWGVPGADPRTALLAVLIQSEITAAAAGDVEIVAISHDAAGKLLAMLPVGDPSIDAARAAHSAVGKLLDAMTVATGGTRRPRRPK